MLRKTSGERAKNLQTNDHINNNQIRTSKRWILHSFNSHHRQTKQIDKIAVDSEFFNKTTHKNKYKMHNIDRLMGDIAQTNKQSSDEVDVLIQIID